MGLQSRIAGPWCKIVPCGGERYVGQRASAEHGALRRAATTLAGEAAQSFPVPRDVPPPRRVRSQPAPRRDSLWRIVRQSNSAGRFRSRRTRSSASTTRGSLTASTPGMQPARETGAPPVSSIDARFGSRRRGDNSPREGCIPTRRPWRAPVRTSSRLPFGLPPEVQSRIGGHRAGRCRHFVATSGVGLRAARLLVRVHRTSSRIWRSRLKPGRGTSLVHSLAASPPSAACKMPCAQSSRQVIHCQASQFHRSFMAAG